MEADQLELINTLLLALTPILWGVVSYFLKDLHRSFQSISAQVNQVNEKLSRFDVHHENHREKIAELTERLERLEAKLYDKQTN